MSQSKKITENKEKISLHGKDFMCALRDSLNCHLSNPDITVRSIAESAGLSVSTLNSILYGNSKNIKISTVISIAHALNISIDELLKADTLPHVVQEAINICRELPEHSRYAVMWYIRHQQAVCHSQPKGSHIVSVMHPRINNNGNLKASGAYSSIDISNIDKEVCRKIFWGVQLDVDFYMPTYSPYDILLIANDRQPTLAENSIILLDGNIFIAKRKVERGIAQYYSVRDGKFRVKETDCDEVIGYVAYVIKDNAFIDEGRY